MLDTVSHVSDAVLKQLETMSEFAAKEFFPPCVNGGDTEGHARRYSLRYVRSCHYGDPRVRMEDAPPV